MCVHLKVNPQNNRAIEQNEILLNLHLFIQFSFGALNRVVNCDLLNLNKRILCVRSCVHMRAYEDEDARFYLFVCRQWV